MSLRVPTLASANNHYSMSQSTLGVDEDFFLRDPSNGSGPPRNMDIPDRLQRATLRLSFPPSYVIVGAYRLLSDKALYIPIWKKCRNGFLRGTIVGCVWVCRAVFLRKPYLTLSTVISDFFNSAAVDQDLLVKVREINLLGSPCVFLSLYPQLSESCWSPE
jgi:hypothetical protein